jgi:hypothetical protein
MPELAIHNTARGGCYPVFLVFRGPARFDGAGGRRYSLCMGSDDPTLEVLRSIRNELQGLRGDVTQVHGEIQLTNDRLERLEQRQTQSEVHLATEIVEVARALGAVKELLQTSLDVRPKVEDHERRIAAIEARVGT